MENIDSLLANFESAVSRLDRQCRYYSEQGEQNRQKAEEDLTYSHQMLSDNFIRCKLVIRDLNELKLATEQGLKETRLIGSELLDLFENVARILKSIEKEKELGVVIERKLSETWSDNQIRIKTYNHSLNRWDSVHKKVNAQHVSIEESIHRMEIQFDKIDEAQRSTYAMLNKFQKNGFYSVKTVRSNMQIESFLANSDEKIAKLRLRRSEEEKELQKMILEIDLIEMEGTELLDWENSIKTAVSETKQNRQKERRLKSQISNSSEKYIDRQ